MAASTEAAGQQPSVSSSGTAVPGDLPEPRVLALTFSSHVFSSTYKDSNTLHLPAERFSPVRRFSDGAASIQAFKAHLEKLGNNSSIKQLQQVMDEVAGISGGAGCRPSSLLQRAALPGLSAGACGALCAHERFPGSGLPVQCGDCSSYLCRSRERHLWAWSSVGWSREGTVSSPGTPLGVCTGSCGRLLCTVAAWHRCSWQGVVLPGWGVCARLLKGPASFLPS